MVACPQYCSGSNGQAERGRSKWTGRGLPQGEWCSIPAAQSRGPAREKMLRVTLKPFESCPWKDHLFSLESESSDNTKILYALYPESEAENSKWRIQCVPVSPDSFENRKSLPEAWRGVRDADLSKVAGIEGCIFCHASGFISGAETYEGVLQMARKALAA